MRVRFLAVLVLALAGLVAWLSFRSDAPLAPPATERRDSAPEKAEDAHGEAIAKDRAPLQTTEALPTATIGPEIHGAVVDLDGKALPGLRVREIGDDGDGVRSGPDGSFAIRPAAEEWTLAVDESEWTTVHPASFDDAPAATGSRIVAARSTEVAGVVVDHGGRPLPGARVELARDGASWSGAAGFEGRFRLESVPAIPGVRATASLAGWRGAERMLDLPSPDELRFVLDREEPDGPEIEGDVVHADGSPAANALVAFGAARTRTDAHGRFRLVCGWFDAPTPLVAVERGLEPAVIEGFGARCLPPSPPPEPAHLVLSGPAHAIEGRVLSSRGDPLKGFEVHLLGATPLDPGGSSRDVAETEAGGSLRGWTDGDGGFAFGGLRGKTYTVIAYGRRRPSRETLVRMDAVPVDASDVILTVPDDPGRASIRGIVRTSEGSPVAGARVGFGRPTSSASPPEYARFGGRPATSGTDGRFELQDAPSGFAVLVASADGFLPAHLELPGSRPRDAVEILLRARRPLQVDASRADPRPDAARAFDAAGSAVPLWIGGAGAASSPAGLVHLRDGVSGAIGASDDARSIALFRGAREVARIPVAPGAGPIEIVWP